MRPALLLTSILFAAVAVAEEYPTTPPDLAAPPADALKSASGLVSKVLREGDGVARPKADDRVTIHYSGWKTDGTLFDTSLTRGQPSTFLLRDVIPGWAEGLQMMVVGEKRRFWIPEALAFKGAREPRGDLVYDIELVDFTEAAKPIPTPEDVAAPPKDAKSFRVRADDRTEATLSYKVLMRGTGRSHPKSADLATVHYSCWQADGTLVISTRYSGKPSILPLDSVIKGWAAGVSQMVIGETRRLWIPEALAYRGEREPRGPLVCDIELLFFERP